MKTALLAAAFFLAAAGVIIAQENKDVKTTKPASGAAAHVMLEPSAIQWGPAPAGLPPGGQAAVLEGDPSKPSYFAIRLKAPANYKIPPHWHGTHERVTVLEGALWLGAGDSFDESKLKEYPAGSYISMPPRMHHFAMTKQPTVLQLATNGPWTITYINAQDDPRNKKTGR